MASPKALPAPLGGGRQTDNGNQPGDGALVQFRDNVLWGTTAAARTPVANVLGVDPDLDKDDLP